MLIGIAVAMGVVAAGGYATGFTKRLLRTFGGNVTEYYRPKMVLIHVVGTARSLR